MIPEIIYPSYDITLPQTLTNCKIRCLTVNDELNLKASVIDNSKLLQHISKTLYTLLIEKPENIKNYNDFIANITTEDYKALVYGVYQATYGDDIEINHICPHCSSTNNSQVKLSKGIQINNYKKGPLEVLNEELSTQLNITKWIITLKVPTMKRLIDLYIDYTKDVENLESYLTYINKIKIQETEIFIDNSKQEIIDFIKLIPAKDRKQLDKFITDSIEQFGSINATYKVTCKSCGGKYTTNVNFVEQLFREL